MPLNTCAIPESGDLRCRGYNKYSQLGFGWGEAYGKIGNSPETIPVVASDVPVINPLSEAWELVNPCDLEVWVKDQGSNRQGTGLALYIANRGNQSVSGMVATYLFSNIEARDKEIGLQDNYTPWSTPSLRSVPGFQHLRQPSSEQWVLTDQIRLYDSSDELIYGWRRK